MRITSADISRYEEDKVVIFDRYGHSFKDPEIRENIPTIKTSVVIKSHYQSEESNALIIDDAEVAGDVMDSLVEQHIGVYGFGKGSALDDKHFRDLRSQFYWVAAKKLEKGLYSFKKLSQKNYDILRSQLCFINRFIEADGRIKVESRDDIKARGLNFSGLADAFMMSEYAYFMGHMADVKEYSYR